MGVGAGLYMYAVVVQKFTISSPDEFLLLNIAILDVSKVIWETVKIWGKLVLITNRKSYMSFWLVP